MGRLDLIKHLVAPKPFLLKQRSVGGVVGWVFDLLDGDDGPIVALWGCHVDENLQDGLGPVTSVGQQTKVRQRLLRGTSLSFTFGQLVT